ncbi:MAG: VOC family protein [Limnobacter sp.]|nr:VOC family protein [Limnobacter sp.]
MIGYVTLGTADLKKSGEFFDKLLAPLGAKRLMELPRGIFWGTALNAPFLGVMTPNDGNPAGCGNGTMVALAVPSREKADEMYQNALALGCTCEGKPGERMPNFYAAYFRTPEGHKMNVFKMG